MKKLSTLLEEITKANGLAILKPGFDKHEDDFYTLLKNSGWRIIQKKKGALTEEQARALYKKHCDKPFYNDLCKYMSSGPCIACLCQKDCKDPIKDMDSLKEKVRKKWGEDEMRNAMHSSDSQEAIDKESNIIYNNAIAEAFENVPVIATTATDVNTLIISSLMSLYAEEVNAFYQYWIVKEFIHGKERPSIQKKYEEYAMDELTDHASKLLKRLNELNADTSILLDLYKNDNLAINKYIIPNISLSTIDSLKQNIEAEEGAINHYKAVIAQTEDVDPTTCQMLKEILADEEEHKSELEDFLKDISNK